MHEIELTIFDRGDQGALIQHMLDEFEQVHKIHVNLQLLDWEAGWSKLVEFALYGNGPDLSEVGSTWVMDLVRMNAVSNISPSEMTHVGEEKDFFPSNWNSGIVATSTGQPPLIWAIPWTSDVRLAYYRRDLFEKANIDPTHVFEHIDSLTQAIQTLAKSVTLPVALSTQRSRINLHNLASWIWDAGGDFLTSDRNQVAFDSPKSLRGMSHYFQLGKYIPANRHKVTDAEADRLFLSGEAATNFSGAWILIDPSMAPIVRDNLSVVAMPSASFVGGTHLLTWKHSRKRDSALTLIDFMVKHSAEHNIFPAFTLPAHIPSWEKIHFIAEPYFSIIIEALQQGRNFPIGRLWGLVEKRLVDTIPIIWEKVLDADGNDIETILAQNVTPLARRINMTLE